MFGESQSVPSTHIISGQLSDSVVEKNTVSFHLPKTLKPENAL